MDKERDELIKELEDRLRNGGESGDVGCQLVLECLYLAKADDIKDRDLTQAMEWYRKAAELGCSVGQLELGRCYCSGDIVERDVSQAVEWFRKSAEQGNSDAQCELGLCYRDGFGITRDSTRAAEWFRRAAEQHHTQAQVHLGICYCSGEGVPKDMVQGYIWLNLAANTDTEPHLDSDSDLDSLAESYCVNYDNPFCSPEYSGDARARREKATLQMTSEQIEAGNWLSQKFFDEDRLERLEVEIQLLREEMAARTIFLRKP